MASQPAAHAAGLRVLRTTRVAPAPPAGEPALPERALPLMFMDAMWLRAQPVERVFFYRLGPGDDDDGGVDAVLSRMEESLPRAIHAFYPLASRIRPTPSETNRYELLYQLGDGVAFTVAEHDGVGVDELATDEPRELAKIAPLVPELPEGGAVLALQVTVLPPKRRGLALGVIVHHSACDGVGSTHFLHTWAAACAGYRKLPELPVIDRTLIRDVPDRHDEFAAPTRSSPTPRAASSRPAPRWPSPLTRRCAASPRTGRGGRSASWRRAGTTRRSRWPGRRGSACTTSTSGSGGRRRWRSCPWRRPARCRRRRIVLAPAASRWA
ncbi:hypothetical protein EE612_011393 [Oryza sativa]|nr:hypothetical protein EE612_011393 [Oryza sativa]